MRRALAASAAAHLGLGLALLLPLPRPGAEPAPPLEIELIQQPPSEQGGASTTEAQAPTEAPNDGPAAAAAPASPSAARAPPAVNLGTAAEDLDPLSVTGDNVVPPAPDARYRNRPPSYPADAARARAEGTVQLLIRVSAAGTPEQVVVAGTSGHPSLDRAARTAAGQWHFRPAQANGRPVPYDYVVNIRFTLSDR